MAAEPTDPTQGFSPSQGPWVSGGDPWSQYSYGTGISTTWDDSDRPFLQFDNIISLLTVLVCLCGAAGNGAVVWLLGFRLKRTPFSVYILNLACADGAYLLSTGVRATLTLLHHDRSEIPHLVLGVWSTSLLVGLGLLMAVSTERCVSVLWPLWHRCRRPAHLSCAVCALIWGLGLCVAVCERVCDVVHIPCDGIGWVYEVMVVVTFLVLCVSSLTLLVQVQCGSPGTWPSRLYMTILVTVLAFLLLALPYTVYVFIPNTPSYSVDGPNVVLISHLLFTLNSAVNPVIYFFVGRYRQQPGRTPLREVLQRALRDEKKGDEQGSTQVSRDITRSP